MKCCVCGQAWPNDLPVRLEGKTLVTPRGLLALGDRQAQLVRVLLDAKAPLTRRQIIEQAGSDDKEWEGRVFGAALYNLRLNLRVVGLDAINVNGYSGGRSSHESRYALARAGQ